LKATVRAQQTEIADLKQRLRSKGDTLLEAQEFVRQRKFDKDGCDCPCCSREVKMRDYRPGAGAVGMLIDIYRDYGVGVDVAVNEDIKRLYKAGGSWSRLKHFGLIEAGEIDGNRKGVYRVTSKGELFLYGRVAVPQFVYIEIGKPDPFGWSQPHEHPPVTVSDVLKTRFDLEEYLARQGQTPLRLRIQE
jgi:hypothetical protein